VRALSASSRAFVELPRERALANTKQAISFAAYRAAVAGRSHIAAKT
jgi:hypothetical protein